MAGKMEDFGTFVTAEQFSSILAHSTPVLIGVFICFWGLLCLLLTLQWGLRLNPCAVWKTGFSTGVYLQ